MKTEFLRSFGLTNSEINVYLTMLPLGNAEAKEIYKLSKVPFGKIYNVLYSLDRKGLVDIQFTRPKVFHAVEPGMAIKNLIDQKDRELSELSDKANEAGSELGRLYREQEGQSPFWTVMMDREPSVHLLGRVFNETEKEALIYFNKLPSIDVNVEDREKTFDHEQVVASFMRLFQRGINVRLLVEIVDDEMPMLRQDIFRRFMKNGRFEVRRTRELTSPFIIIDEKKVILSIWDPLSEENVFIASIYLWNAQLARKLKDRFEALWEDSVEFDLG
ncbi:MAG: TrmB family transcriptional regulator [Thermoplasmata archaeon]|nr:TrmB family transcriptional regulator [Thermoplasmata archaeon]